MPFSDNVEKICLDLDLGCIKFLIYFQKKVTTLAHRQNYYGWEEDKCPFLLHQIFYKLFMPQYCSWAQTTLSFSHGFTKDFSTKIFLLS